MINEQPVILSLDTATPCSSVAITTGTRDSGQVLASLDLTGNVSHSRRLLGSISWLMESIGLQWPDIDAVAVSLGPGSFTGLRIGMATAKGLAAAANKQMFGISTLDGLASKCVTDNLVCSMLDARKKEIYTAFYRRNNQGLSERVSEVAVISPQDLMEKINEPTVLVGDGAVVYKTQFQERLGSMVTFVPCNLNVPQASALGLLAGESYLEGDCLEIGAAVPIYIRSSDAELNLLKKRQKEAGAKGSLIR